ncbi:hypothetical protein [Flagellimonas marinaquae]
MGHGAAFLGKSPAHHIIQQTGKPLSKVVVNDSYKGIRVPIRRPGGLVRSCNVIDIVSACQFF